MIDLGFQWNIVALATLRPHFPQVGFYRGVFCAGFLLQQPWYPVALQHYQGLTHWATFHHSQLRETLQCQQNKDDKKGESNKKTVSTLSIVLSLTSGKLVMPCCSEEKKIFTEEALQQGWECRSCNGQQSIGKRLVFSQGCQWNLETEVNSGIN